MKQITPFRKLLAVLFVAALLLVACGTTVTDTNAQDNVPLLPHTGHIEAGGTTYAVVEFTDSTGWHCVTVVNSGGGIYTQGASPNVTCHP